jgi:hypothetical protein
MIVQGTTTSFKRDLVTYLLSDTLKMALYNALATLNQDTTEYVTTNEISGTGYTAGGQVLSNVTVTTSEGVTYISFDNPVWNPGAFTARGALIYNASKSNASIAVLNFGYDVTSQNTFTVPLPPNTASSALIRIN